MVMIELLKLGLPWDVLDEMNNRDITTVLAFNEARKEQEMEQVAHQEAKQFSQY